MSDVHEHEHESGRGPEYGPEPGYGPEYGGHGRGGAQGYGAQWSGPPRQPGWAEQPLPQRYPAYMHGPPEPRNGLGIAAVVLGLVGLLLGLVPLTGWLAVICGVTGGALALAGIGRLRSGRATNKKTTYAGLVASVGAVALGVLGIVLFFNAVDQLGDDLDGIGRDLGGDIGAGEEAGAGNEGTGDAGAGGGASAGTPENPVAAGQLAPIGDWAVAVQPANLDAGAKLRVPADVPEGHRYVLARADVRYDGEGSGNTATGLIFKVLGADGVVYDERCGLPHDPLTSVGELFQGATAAGSVCVAVPAEQLSGAVWVVDALLTLDDERAYIALQ